MATPQERTLNQIVNEFKEIATQHYQINSFACGTLDDFASSGDTRYPAMWVEYDTIDFDKTTIQFNFKFWILDRVKKDRSNLQEVLSDTATISGQVKSQILSPDYGWRGTLGSLTPIYEPFMEDEVAGWQFPLSIMQPYTNDMCAIPFRNSPI